MVFDETRDIRDVLKRLGKFFAHESCGKCYPRQMGTQRQMEVLTASGGQCSARRLCPLAGCRLDDDGRESLRFGSNSRERGIVGDEVMAWVI